MFNPPAKFEDAVITREVGRFHPDIHKVCIDFLENYGPYSKQGKAPMFAGTSGLGKSYAAAAIGNRITAVSDLWVHWAPVGETLDRVMALRDFRDSKYWELDGALKHCDLLILDDFAHLREYPRLVELFWIYVNHRYENKRPTIFTANLDLSDGWEVLDKIFGLHMRRRLQEMASGLTVVL